MANQEALSRVFHALADPTRRAVVNRLARGPASVSDLAEPFDMKLPTVMKHLRVLESGGLVRSKKHGRVRTCELQPRQLGQAQAWIEKNRALWARRLDRFEAFLEEQQRSEEDDG